MNVYSSVKIFHHKDALDAIQDHKHCAPFYIRLKPTNICNHHCAYCTYGSGDTDNKTNNRDSINHRDEIPWSKLQEIINDMGDMHVRAITFSGGGEPTAYPHIADAARLAKNRNIELSLISNGQLLSGDIAKEFYDARWIRISFDSPNAEEYAKLRGITTKGFDTVCSNIENFAKYKSKDCTLGINFVVSKANAFRVYEAAELLKALGADNVKFAAVVENTPHYHDDIKEEVIAQIKKAQAELADENFHIFGNYVNDCNDKQFTAQPFPTCYTCRLVTVIGADQKVYFCHTRAYDSEAVVGDLKDQSFKDMWFSRQTIARLDELDPMKDCRNFCVYEDRNMLIQSYMDVDMRHVDFI